MVEKSAFTGWRLWDRSPKWTEDTLAETLDGGQAFRWNRIENHWEGRWAHNCVRLRLAGSRLEIALPVDADEGEMVEALDRYFAIETDFSALTDRLPWRNDPVLEKAIRDFPGLRILRQPFGETLLTFLCSSTKRIIQIKRICESLAHDLGSNIPGGGHALPSWEQIAETGEARLRETGMGYRARYINATAQFLATHPGWLEATEQAPTPEARERLCELPGVGRKIADCVLLFGAGRLEAFPIDTWVERILTRAYGLEGWKSEQLQDFARIHFGDTAGLAQQYLFAAARAGLIPS